MKERISNAADFPGLVVYREALPAGPVYSIEFQNKELRPPMAGTETIILENLWALLWIVLFLSLFGWGVYALYNFPQWGIWNFAFLFLPIALVFYFGLTRITVRRRIELDFAGREFRVWRNGRVKLRKPLTLQNIQLAIEPHYAVFRGTDGSAQLAAKTHCLVGYFGMAGADRAVLLCRYERHPVGGLREVAEAVMWAWEAGCREVD